MKGNNLIKEETSINEDYGISHINWERYSSNESFTVTKNDEDQDKQIYDDGIFESLSRLDENKTYSYIRTINENDLNETYFFINRNNENEIQITIKEISKISDKEQIEKIKKSCVVGLFREY